MNNTTHNKSIKDCNSGFGLACGGRSVAVPYGFFVMNNPNLNTTTAQILFNADKYTGTADEKNLRSFYTIDELVEMPNA